MNPARSAFVAKVDYLAARTQAHPWELLELLEPLFTWTGEPFTWEPCKPKNGHTSAYALMLGQALIGRMDWGGETMRGWVHLDIPGTGCSFIDWRELTHLTMRCELRRCDPCVTFFDGSVTHDMVLAAYDAGGFNGESGGRKPKARKVEAHGDPWAGRTVYVGTRGGEKMLRAYEKGLQMLATSRVQFDRDADPKTVLIDGDPAVDIYRIEVEFHASDRRCLPWDMCANPLKYWRGAYPWLATLLPGEATALKAPVLPDLASTLEATAANIRRQYGKALYTMLVAKGGDINAVFGMVCGTEHCERLVRGGALLEQVTALEHLL